MHVGVCKLVCVFPVHMNVLMYSISPSPPSHNSSPKFLLHLLPPSHISSLIPASPPSLQHLSLPHLLPFFHSLPHLLSLPTPAPSLPRLLPLSHDSSLSPTSLPSLPCLFPLPHHLPLFHIFSHLLSLSHISLHRSFIQVCQGTLELNGCLNSPDQLLYQDELTSNFQQMQTIHSHHC